MKKILVLYYSRHGSVRRLANLIAEGVERVKDCEFLSNIGPFCKEFKASLLKAKSTNAHEAQLARENLGRM